ncbi:BRCT domain-containing protein [Stutzerimonas nitrititolerans]|uniref:BRCT domain-containing protein n=1 Tax=Stutzerimonas nitrititolerans TaxID=2482751 RepID=UPI0028AB2F31|nr:BRCT domain-containing protein [Stutzerimonas nitrititolerans]
MPTAEDMPRLHFIYRDAHGAVSERTLTRWSENTRYIQGRSETGSLPKTYWKDCMVQFLAGEELLLNEAAPLTPEPKPKASPDERPHILFTGFKSAKREVLEHVAAEQGLRVMKTASKTLTFLCIGDNAGPTNIEKAREAGAFILNELRLRTLFESGELLC